MVSPLKRFLSIILIVVSLTGCTAPTPAITPTPSATPLPTPATTPTTSATPLPAPTQGSPGIGDPYYPNLGNGGYDIQHYTITLDVDPPTNTITGSTTITAIAKEYLDSFNLDFHDLTVDSVSVDDTAAEFYRDEDELTILPSSALDIDQKFSIAVTYHGSPQLFSSHSFPARIGWSHAEDGTINVMSEPDAASSWFPNNNHPRDKATYRFEITVPKPWVVAATGSLKETKENNDKTTFIWEMDQPMATYLASINIDHYDLVTQTGPNGVTIRNYFPTDYSLRFRFDILPEAITFFEDLFGSYPFDEYGVVIASASGLCATASEALEAQTMSVHCPNTSMATEDVIVHELAHQWFGDSVSLNNWQDIWLKEGFATYSSWLWVSKNDPAEMKRIAKEQRSSLFDNPDYSVAEPSKNNLYSDESYTGGALVLQALRQQVGDETFFKILQTYAERYRYNTAGTKDFISVAEEISNQDLKSFFDAWVFGKKVPKLPE